MSDFIALGSSKLLIDLSRVNYLSSSGIGVLVELTKQTKKQGGDLALLNPQRNVEEVFAILGFAPFVNLTPSPSLFGARSAPGSSW